MPTGTRSAATSSSRRCSTRSRSSCAVTPPWPGASRERATWPTSRCASTPSTTTSADTQTSPTGPTSVRKSADLPRTPRRRVPGGRSRIASPVTARPCTAGIPLSPSVSARRSPKLALRSCATSGLGTGTSLWQPTARTTSSAPMPTAASPRTASRSRTIPSPALPAPASPDVARVVAARDRGPVLVPEPAAGALRPPVNPHHCVDAQLSAQQPRGMQLRCRRTPPRHRGPGCVLCAAQCRDIVRAVGWDRVELSPGERRRPATRHPRGCPPSALLGRCRQCHRPCR